MIIQSDRIITAADRAPLTDGAIVIRYGRIHAVGNAARLKRLYSGHRIVRLERAVIMPGLVNVHAHLELPHMYDEIPSLNYTDWVLRLLARKKHLTNKDYSAAARANITALIRSGTTMVADITTHGCSPLLLCQSGIRAIIFHEIISMLDDRSTLVIPRLRPASRLVQYGYSPHSPHTVSEMALKEILRISNKLKLRLSMHVAETREETLLLQKKKSSLERLYAAARWDTNKLTEARSSFAYLLRLGLLGPSFLAVHAVQADTKDIAIIKRTRTGVAHCPRSNHELGVGTMPLKAFLDAHISVGLGTDSLASVPTLNLWDEMRYAYRVHRRSGVSPQDILHMATIGGARVLGMDRDIGSIAPGKQTDIIVVPLPRNNTGDLYSDLLRETKTCMMNMVNGRVIYRNTKFAAR